MLGRHPGARLTIEPRILWLKTELAAADKG
jgi:hypothetical protein